MLIAGHNYCRKMISLYIKRNSYILNRDRKIGSEFGKMWKLRRTGNVNVEKNNI